MLGYVFYIIHGHVIGDLPILCMGAVALVQAAIIVILYFVYKTKS